MNKWVRRGSVAVIAVVVLAAAALTTASQLAERKMQRHVEVKVQPVAMSADAGSLERGRYLFLSRGCADCHGANGGGATVIDDGKGMRVRSANITKGTGSVVVSYTNDDWTRAIRHGVKPDGRPIIVMPSEEYARLTDVDLAAVVAYAKQLPPVAGQPALVEFPLPVKVVYALGILRDAAEKIDHTLPPGQPVPEGVTAAHGAYVANACIGCHGAALSGGRIPGAPPDWPAAANLTPGAGSALPRYADAQSFAAMMRSGKRPDGSEVSKVMPFVSLKEMNDVDLQALYLHLKGLPPRAIGAAS